ncbi:hypothetical protein [Agrobacterium vitis]|uniref:hypothetical protein n=1 Tax=Agrobacterium vitis TaxID=373 RepID=UPI0012E8B5EC|nr:hypothetical protein [Agrobacterium vitis]MVA35480.1 hypothetical protein [Agrobacterium vitis]
MSVQYELIKTHAVDRLDREAVVHRKGHQNVHARRYVMPRAGRPDIEIMIIVKGTHLQLWCEAEAMDRIKGSSLGGEFRSGAETYQPDRNGKIQYGRHSGLKVMDRLHHGDAWRFVPKTIGALDGILDCIRRS